MSASHAVSASNPRVAAARVVEAVLSGRSLSELIPQHLSDFDQERDRSLAQELSYGTLRYYPRLEKLIGCDLSMWLE